MKTAAYTHLQLMDPKLEFKYLRLEKTRNRLLDELEGLDDDLLNSPAADGKWSINQIICHLMKVDGATVGYVQYKVKKQENIARATLAGSFKSLLLKLALQSGRKFKAPEVVADVPETASFNKLRQQWDEIRFSLEDTLTDIPEHLLDKCLFKHPYAGPLTISQTLTFLQDHFDHHLRQINQLKAKLIRASL